MNVNLKDLIAALPQENDRLGSELEDSHEKLREQLADLAFRPVPTGSLHRLWTMGELSAEIALAYLAFWIRSWFANAEKKKQDALETNLRVAMKLLYRLSYLRGAAAKVGQALGSLPEVLPDTVVSTLDRLHFSAPPMHFSLLREMVSNELEGEPEDVFAEFDREAFAAASLGQVHRARLRSGEEAAVKIQYPGIGRTIAADLANLNALLFPARLGKEWDWVKGQFEEVRRMLSQEIDYRQEARNMRSAAAVFNPEDGIVVPRVYADYSTQRVLTMDYIDGLHIQDFLATNPTQQLRNRFAEKIQLVSYRMYFAGISYADPHAGNYVFMEDGRLGLLDFGCIRHYGPEERHLQELAAQVIDGSLKMTELLRHACKATDADLANEEFVRLLGESGDWAMEPVRVPMFNFGDDEYLKRGVSMFVTLVAKRFSGSHPMYVYFNRMIFGVTAMLYLLRAEIDARTLYQRELARWRDSL